MENRNLARRYGRSTTIGRLYSLLTITSIRSRGEDAKSDRSSFPRWSAFVKRHERSGSANQVSSEECNQDADGPTAHPPSHSFHMDVLAGGLAKAHPLKSLSSPVPYAGIPSSPPHPFSQPPVSKGRTIRRSKKSYSEGDFYAAFLFLLLSTVTGFAQQSEITQFSLISGYSYLSTSSLNLAQRGFNGDIAQNVRPWLSIGFDFSIFTGYSTLFPSYLNSATQRKLAQLLPPGVPPSAVSVPYSSSTYTYQLGPQINYRRLRKVTFFVRPALGLLHAKIQTNPRPNTAPIVSALMGGKLSSADNALFYGFGGGATWEITPHFGLRVTADLARFDFFPNVLNGSRNGVRISLTPKFGFGKNIMRRD